MIQQTHKKTMVMLKESFVPVMLVAVGLGIVLVYVNLKSSLDANQVETIMIRSDATNVEVDEFSGASEQANIDISGARKADPLYQKAAMAIEKKDWDIAEGIYQQIIQERPDSQAHSDLGVLYYNQKQFEKALQQFALSLTYTPVYINVYVNRGLVQTKLKQYEKAQQDYNIAITKVPYHYQAHLNLGVVLIKTKNYPAAIDTLKKASSLAGGQRKAKALYNLGLAYRAMGGENKVEAEKSLQAAIRIRPDYIEARFALAALEPNTSTGRDNAMQQYNKVLDLNRQYSPAYFRIAQLKTAENDKVAAQQAYIKAIQYDPNYSKARYNLALSYLSSERWADARNQFEKILTAQPSKQPDNARIHFQLGRAAYGEKDYGSALVEYEKALGLKKGRYDKALLNIGLTYKAQKQYKKAIATYKKVLESNGAYPQAWYNLGLAYMRNKKYKQAEESLLTAIKYKADYAQAWFNLGVLYKKQKQYDQSIEAYQKALVIKPNYRKAKLNLAVRYANKKQYLNAILLYKQVLDKDDRYATAWINLGIAQLNVDNNGKAEHALKRALKLQPDSVKAKQMLSRVYVNNNQFGRAIDLLQEAIESKEHDAQLRLELSQAYNRAGKMQKARTALVKALKLEPGNVKIKAALKKLNTLS